MIRASVEETSSTSGTTSFTLAGATTNNITFNTAFGTNRLFKYYARAGSQWEQGTGYLSASTTLVRQKVEFNSLGTVALINFSTAPTVFCDIAPSAYSPPIPLRAAGEYVRSEDIGSAIVEATLTLSAGYCYFMPFWYSSPNQIDQLSFYVANNTTSTIGRVGLYAHSTTKNQPGKLLVQSGELDVSTPGWREFTLSTPLSIQGEQHWVAIIVSGGVQVMAYPYQNHGRCFLNVNRGGGTSSANTQLIDDRGSGWLVSNGGSGMIDFPTGGPDVINTSANAPYIIVRTT